MRVGKLQGIPSPFLDSGFHFDDNWDLTLNDEDRANTLRVNMVVWHLLSRGLEEMGSSQNESHDQTYITVPQYWQEIYPRRDEEPTNPVLTEEQRAYVLTALQHAIVPGISEDREGS